MAAAGPEEVGGANEVGAPAGPRLLSGGNPQVPKGEGEGPVRAWLAAVPGWKRAACERIDAAVAAAVPGVRRAVKYNSPLYGAPGRDDWFLSFHCFAGYVKVAFHRGASLDPPPPVASRQAHVRYLHVREGEALDEEGLAAWARQASALPGERL